MMRHSTITWSLSFGLGLFCLLLGGGTGLALTLDEAKEKGWLGERPDGYLGKVSKDLPDDAIALMKEVNGKRRKVYKKIADKNGTDLEAVQSLAGEKAQKKTKSGNYILLPSGEWSAKP